MMPKCRFTVAWAIRAPSSWSGYVDLWSHQWPPSITVSLVLWALVGVVSWPSCGVASESKTTPRADSGFCERGMERGRR